MQAASQRAKRSLVNRFAARRMGADGAGDVLECRPPFNRKCQRRRQFRNSRPGDRLPAGRSARNPHRPSASEPGHWRRPECHDLARQRLRSVQGAWQDVHGAVPSILTGDRPTTSTERRAGCRANREQRTTGSRSGLASMPKSIAAPPSPSTIIRNSTICSPKRCTSARSWDAAASESVAMALKTTDEARHAANGILLISSTGPYRRVGR